MILTLASSNSLTDDIRLSLTALGFLGSWRATLLFLRLRRAESRYLGRMLVVLSWQRTPSSSRPPEEAAGSS